MSFQVMPLSVEKIQLTNSVAWKQRLWALIWTCCNTKEKLIYASCKCEYWYRREVLPMLTKTDSNHEKSEVKVVFIRNGFHTTLLHKTRKSLPIWNLIPINEQCKNRKRVTISKIINFFICPNVQTCTTSLWLSYIVLLASILLARKKSERTSNVHTHTI